MTYSRQTLAAFSEAIGSIYSSRNARRATAAGLFPAGTPEEDIAFLHGLLDRHRAAACPIRNPGSRSRAQPEPGQRDFVRLRGAGLTPRECEVLFWMAEGKPDAAIATVVGCATKTVSKHVENILAKLGAETRLGAAHVAHAWLKKNG